jgi:hypothetical protein
MADFMSQEASRRSTERGFPQSALAGRSVCAWGSVGVVPGLAVRRSAVPAALVRRHGGMASRVSTVRRLLMAGLGIRTLAGLLVSVMRLWSIAAAAVVGLLILAAGWLVRVLRLVVACKSAQQLQEAKGKWSGRGVDCLRVDRAIVQNRRSRSLLLHHRRPRRRRTVVVAERLGRSLRRRRGSSVGLTLSLQERI